MYRNAAAVGLGLGVCLACSADFDESAQEAIDQTEQALTGNFVPFSETPVAGQYSFGSGRVRAILPVNDRVYVGGKFSITANVNGVNTTYKNLVAFDIPSDPAASLQLVTEFNPSPNEEVNALASDWLHDLYVGGVFTRIGPSAARRDRAWLAAVSLESGLPTDFRADVSGSIGDCESCISGDPYCGAPAVKALSVVGGNLLVGGNFSTIRDNQGANTRLGIAAVSIYDGIVDPELYSIGVTKGYVSSIQLDLLFNTVYVGGSFQTIEGQDRSCMAAFWAMGGIKDTTFSELNCPESTDKDHYWTVKDIAVDMMHASVYVAVGGKGSPGATNRVFGFGDLGATYRWKSSTLGGDAQAVDYYQNVVYVGTHDGMFKNGDKSNGDAFKIAGLDLDNGKFVVDGSHQGKSCSKYSTTNCWLPVSDAAGSTTGIWGVAEIAHYEGDTPRLFAGGFISHFGDVTNTKLFGAFSKIY